MSTINANHTQGFVATVPGLTTNQNRAVARSVISRYVDDAEIIRIMVTTRTNGKSATFIGSVAGLYTTSLTLDTANGDRSVDVNTIISLVEI